MDDDDFNSSSNKTRKMSPNSKKRTRSFTPLNSSHPTKKHSPNTESDEVIDLSDSENSTNQIVLDNSTHNGSFKSQATEIETQKSSSLNSNFAASTSPNKDTSSSSISENSMASHIGDLSPTKRPKELTSAWKSIFKTPAKSPTKQNSDTIVIDSSKPEEFHPFFQPRKPKPSQQEVKEEQPMSAVHPNVATSREELHPFFLSKSEKAERAIKINQAKMEDLVKRRQEDARNFRKETPNENPFFEPRTKIVSLIEDNDTTHELPTFVRPEAWKNFGRKCPEWPTMTHIGTFQIRSDNQATAIKIPLNFNIDHSDQNNDDSGSMDIETLKMDQSVMKLWKDIQLLPFHHYESSPKQTSLSLSSSILKSTASDAIETSQESKKTEEIELDSSIVDIETETNEDENTHIIEMDVMIDDVKREEQLLKEYCQRKAGILPFEATFEFASLPIGDIPAELLPEYLERQQKSSAHFKAKEEAEKLALTSDIQITDRERTKEIFESFWKKKQNPKNKFLPWTSKYAPDGHNHIICHQKWSHFLFHWLNKWKKEEEAKQKISKVTATISELPKSSSSTGNSSWFFQPRSQQAQQSQQQQKATDKTHQAKSSPSSVDSFGPLRRKKVSFDYHRSNDLNSMTTAATVAITTNATSSNGSMNNGRKEIDDGNDSFILLLVGPSGIGKSSSIYAIAHELGFGILELNATHKRSGSSLRAIVEEATQSKNVGKTGGLSLILIEDIDQIFAEEDVGFAATLISLCENTKKPIILTCHEPPQAIEPKLPPHHSFSLSFPSPCPTLVILSAICFAESIPNPNFHQFYQYSSYFEFNLRAMINNLQFQASHLRKFGWNEMFTTLNGIASHPTIIPMGEKKNEYDYMKHQHASTIQSLCNKYFSNFGLTHVIESTFSNIETSNYQYLNHNYPQQKQSLDLLHLHYLNNIEKISSSSSSQQSNNYQNYSMLSFISNISDSVSLDDYITGNLLTKVESMKEWSNQIQMNSFIQSLSWDSFTQNVMHSNNNESQANFPENSHRQCFSIQAIPSKNEIELVKQVSFSMTQPTSSNSTLFETSVMLQKISELSDESRLQNVKRRAAKSKIDWKTVSPLEKAAFVSILKLPEIPP